MHQDETTVSSSTEKSNWLQNFKIPWNKMPNSLMNTLNEGKRPSPSQRREMVRVIADAIRKFTHLPGKKAINYITKNVVEKYPTLKDTLCGDVISDGNTYFSKQIRNRLENLNRGPGPTASKKKRSLEVKEQSKPRTLAEKYGCCNWQPSISEDEEVLQEDQRKKLLILYQRGPQINDSEMYDLVSKSYALQRKEINHFTFTIEEFRNRWPCVFLKSGLLNHFFKLVDINLESRLEEELKKKGYRIINFLRTVPPGSNKIELSACLSKLPNEPFDEASKILLILLQLLAAYFGENFQDIYRNCEVTANQMDIQNIMNLPCTPCILVCGKNVFDSECFMLLIDGAIVNDDIKNYLDAFLMFMAAYYAFNIKYPESIAATLEFMQRCMLNINPSRGSKQKKIVKDGILPRVLSLLNNMSAFEWL